VKDDSTAAIEAPTGEGKLSGKLDVVAFKGGYDIDFYAATGKEFADKNLVLVEVDFPKGKTLPNAVTMQNDGLQQQYQVKGFPTLVLLSPAGKVIKQQSGYIPGGPKGFIDWVNSAK
jgi:hypothetical protein